MKLKPVRYLRKSYIEMKVNDLLFAFSQAENIVLQPPIPIEQIVEFYLGLDIEIIEFDNGEQDTIGALDMNSRIIFISNKVVEESLERYCFTLAHEVGHHDLHFEPAPLELFPDEQLIVCNKNANPSREWQANYFAACLLMPQDMLQNSLIEINNIQWKNLYAIAQQYSVSITALRKRLEDLDKIHIVDKKIHRNKQEAHKQLRLF